MKEFGGGRDLLAVLTLLPWLIAPLRQPCCACTAFPGTRLQEEQNLHCKHCSRLLEVAVDMIQSRENILHMFLSGTHTDLGKLETGDKCLQELQLVPGADCRHRKNKNKQVGESRKVYNCGVQQEPELTTRTVIFWQQRIVKSMLHPDPVAS